MPSLYQNYNNYIKSHMSMDKTLRLTDQSISQITIYQDRNPRISIGQTHDSFLSLPKLNGSHSLKSLRIQTSRCSNLQYQNEILRAQIISLKKQLRSEREFRENKEQELEKQIFKLKNLIQKSYYSLRGIQNENINMKKQISIEKQINEKQRQRIRYLEQKTDQLCAYIKGIKSNHEIEVNLIWERVSHLQKNLESVVRLIEDDKKDEKIYMHSRTSSYEGSKDKKYRLN